MPVETRNPHKSDTVAAARPNGRNRGHPGGYTSLALTPGPYCTRPLTPAGAFPAVIVAQHGHTNDTTSQLGDCRLWWRRKAR